MTLLIADRVVPHAVFLDPEVGSVDLTEPAARCGVPLVLMSAAPETPEAAVARAVTHGIDRIRLVGPGEPDLLTAAARAGVHVVTDPVTAEGRVELLHHLREQSVSRTLHRYGNLI